MKKYIVIIGLLLGGMLAGCHKADVGYLQTDNAKYVPDTLNIRLVLDEELDAFRIYNVSPWVGPKMQGVIGTPPIYFEVTNVTSSSEGANPTLFKHLLSVRGGGRMEFPLVSDITPGRYVVSLRIYNEGSSKEVKNAFTFIVK